MTRALRSHSLWLVVSYIGLMLLLAPIPRTWPGKLGRGALVAGTILLAQSLALWTYALVTARSHELPWPHLLPVDAEDPGSDGHAISLNDRGIGQIPSLRNQWIA